MEGKWVAIQLARQPTLPLVRLRVHWPRFSCQPRRFGLRSRPTIDRRVNSNNAPETIGVGVALIQCFSSKPHIIRDISCMFLVWTPLRSYMTGLGLSESSNVVFKTPQKFMSISLCRHCVDNCRFKIRARCVSKFRVTSCKFYFRLLKLSYINIPFHP